MLPAIVIPIFMHANIYDLSTKIRKGNYPFRILTMCLTLHGTLYSLPYNFAIL